MSLRKAFLTDKSLETRGIEIDYGTSIFTCARAGGANKAYKKALAKALKPFRVAIEADNIDDERARPALIKAFAEHVVLGCKVLITGENDEETWVQGLEGKEPNTFVSFTTDNLIALLTEVPELYQDLQQKTIGRKLFLEDMEEASKN